MCYEYEDLKEWARLAEQQRREREIANKPARETPAIVKPAPAEKDVKERQPVPA